MNNLLSYCGLVDARISSFEKYLPVIKTEIVLEKIPTVPVGEVPAHIRARIQIGNFPQEKRQPQPQTQTLVTQM